MCVYVVSYILQLGGVGVGGDEEVREEAKQQDMGRIGGKGC